ncbi:hypothetical protein [Streptomyces specialis]|uniref:hypothetical protein n=1 Tax=Streptomyces specialis TaxID=498367 RepID=UPI00073F101C|nr:hypothetical protein [Streptomyces specialis]
MANAELLRTTLRHIQQNPDSWDQASWRCGSTGCFAFHAALLAGAELADPQTTVPGPGGTTPNYDSYLACNTAARDLGFTQPRIHISDFAQAALGLETEKATELFASWRELPDLEALVADLAPEPAATR